MDKEADQSEIEMVDPFAEEKTISYTIHIGKTSVYNVTFVR